MSRCGSHVIEKPRHTTVQVFRRTTKHHEANGKSLTPTIIHTVEVYLRQPPTEHCRTFFARTLELTSKSS